MSYKESLEELIDEYEEDEPFLTDGARVVLSTYRKMLEEERAINSGSLTRINRVGLGDSVLSPKPSSRRTR